MARKVAAQLAETLPALSHWAVPREIAAGDNYWSTRLTDDVDINSMFAYLSEQREEFAEFARLSDLFAHGTPTYHVSKTMTSAMLRTEPPVDMPAAEFRLPYRGIRFVFERGAVVLADGSEVACIDATYREKGDNLALPKPVEDDFARIGMPCPGGRAARGITATATGFTFSLTRVHPLTGRYSFHRVQKELMGYETTIGDIVNKQHIVETGKLAVAGRDDIADAEVGLMGDMTAFIVNAVLLLTSRPEYVDGGEEIAPAQVRKGQVRRAAKVAPRFLGKKFAYHPVTSEEGNASGRKLPPGWRAGHFKQIAYGPARSRRYRDWIAPYQYGTETALCAA